MSAKLEKNGTWSADISYYQNGKRRHTCKRNFKTKREAQRFEIDFRDGLIITSNLKFEEALESYKKDKKTNRKQSTNDEIERICNDYFSCLNNIYIKDLKLRHYQSIKENLSESNLSTSYKNKILTIGKSISKFISIHFETSDVARGLTKFKNFDLRKEMQTWDLKEFKLFLSYVDREIYHDLFYILYFSGARIGEIRALYKDDFQSSYLNISKSIRHAKDGVTTPKNQYSVRRINLDSKSIEIVKKYQSLKGQYLLGNDTPLSESSVGRIFRGYIKEVQKDYPDFKQLRIHDLRHSHATLLINNGANIVAVSKRLGHANIEITLKTYTHLFQENEIKLLEVIENIIS